MPIFEYKAMTPAGKTKAGIIDADSPKDARALLRKDRLLVTTLKESRGGGKRGTWFQQLRSLQGVSGPNKKRTEQVSAVTRQLASLLLAGIPLADALRAIIEQAPDRQIESVFRDIREKVTTGTAFGDAVAMHPQYFAPIYSAMVRAGEASGALDQVLLKLADFLQAQTRLKNKVGAAMIYPMIMVIVGILVVAILVTFVVPKVTQMLEAKGNELPLATRILIDVSDFVKDYYLFVAVGLILLIAFFNWITRLPKGRLIWHGMKLKMPIFGDLMVKQSVARFATTFSTLLRSGVPAIQAIQVTKGTLENQVLTNALEQVHDHILEGADIATPLKSSGAFPPIVSYMVAVGEQAGNLEQVLEQVASTYDEEVDLATQRLTAALEPIIIVCLAVVVGGIIFSIVQPIVKMQSMR